MSFVASGLKEATNFIQTSSQLFAGTTAAPEGPAKPIETEQTKKQATSPLKTMEHSLKLNMDSVASKSRRQQQDSDDDERRAGRKLLLAQFVAELLGTFLLILIGDGAILSYISMRKAPDVFATCLAFGVGAMLGTIVARRISGAHLNPAASLAAALNGQLSGAQLAAYVAAQYLGGVLAAVALRANYSEALAAIAGNGPHSAFGSPNSTAAGFATFPAPYVSVWGAFGDQLLGTAVLMFCLTAVCDKRNNGLSPSAQPFAVSLTVALVCVAFSANCGAIFNPARDLAPRAVLFATGFDSVFEPLNRLYWLVAGVVGPHVGAVVGVGAYRALVWRALDAVDAHDAIRAGEQ